MHEKLNLRNNTKPAIIGLSCFSDSSQLCGCCSSLFLSSTDVNDRDFSRELCLILGLDRSCVYIEADGLTKLGLSRLISLLESAMEHLDSRVTFIILSDKNVNSVSLQKIIELKFSLPKNKNKSKRFKPNAASVTNLEKMDDFVDEFVTSFSSNEMSDKEKIKKLEEEIEIFKSKSESEKAFNVLKIEELEMIVSKCSSRKDNLEREVEGLKSGLMEKSEDNEELKIEVDDLKRRLLEKSKDILNFEVKEGVLKNSLSEEKKSNQDLQNTAFDLKSNLEIKSNNYQELSLQMTEIKNENQEIRSTFTTLKAAENEKYELFLNEKVQQMSVLQCHLDEKAENIKELEIRLKSAVAKCESQDLNSNNESSGLVLKDVDLNPKMTALQEDIRKVQNKYSTASPSEVIRRSIKSFGCKVDFKQLDAGEFECCITVTDGVVLECPVVTSFKGIGTSKKKFKNDAFGKYLMILINCKST